jgi:hypothetical protein
VSRKVVAVFPIPNFVAGADLEEVDGFGTTEMMLTKLISHTKCLLG